jgi:hypothetical protein
MLFYAKGIDRRTRQPIERPAPQKRFILNLDHRETVTGFSITEDR